MKKLWKPMLSVLLSISLVVGLFALPASAAREDLNDPHYYPATSVPFAASEITDGKCTKSGFLFESGIDDGSVFETGADNVLEVDLDIVNNTGLPMTYTIRFWNGIGLMDRLGKNGTVSDNNKFIDPSVIFNPTGNYAPQNATSTKSPGYTPALVARDWEVYDYYNMGIDGHNAHQLPAMFYLNWKGGKTPLDFYGGLYAPNQGQPDPLRPAYDPLTEVPPLPIAGNVASVRWGHNFGAGGLNASNYRTGPFKRFNAQGNVRNNNIVFWDAPDVSSTTGSYDSYSGSLAAKDNPATVAKDERKDEFTFHHGWPYDSLDIGAATLFDQVKYPMMKPNSGGGILPNDVFSAGMYYWDVPDNALGGLRMDWNGTFYTRYTGGLGGRLLRNFYGNSNGVQAPLDDTSYHTGGVSLRYWVKYEIVATFPKVRAEFYLDDALTELYKDGSDDPYEWYSYTNKTLLSALADGDVSWPPDPPTINGKTFSHWTYQVGENWVRVPNTWTWYDGTDWAKMATFPASFNPAGVDLEECWVYYDNSDSDPAKHKWVVCAADPGAIAFTVYHLKSDLKPFVFDPTGLDVTDDKWLWYDDTDSDPDNWEWAEMTAFPAIPTFAPSKLQMHECWIYYDTSDGDPAKHEWAVCDTNPGSTGFKVYHLKRDWYCYSMKLRAVYTPQVRVEFYLDKTLDELYKDGSDDPYEWYSYQDKTLLSALADGDVAWPPDPPAKGGKSFSHWAYQVGTEWVKVPNTWYWYDDRDGDSDNWDWAGMATFPASFDPAGVELAECWVYYDNSDSDPANHEWVVCAASPGSIAFDVYHLKSDFKPFTFDPTGLTLKSYWIYEDEHGVFHEVPTEPKTGDDLGDGPIIVVNKIQVFYYDALKLHAFYKPLVKVTFVNEDDSPVTGFPARSFDYADAPHKKFGDSGVGLLADAPAIPGKEFDGWYIMKEGVLTKVDPATFLFKPETYGITTDANGDYSFKLIAKYKTVTTTDPEPVKVQVKVNGQLFPSGMPFIWDSAVDTMGVEEKLIAEQLLSLIEGMKDGCLWFIPPNDPDNPIKVEPGCGIKWDDPDFYKVDKVNGVYIFYLVAEDQVGIDTLVRFFLDEGTSPTPYTADGTTPYEAWVRAYDTVAGQTGAGKAFPAGLPVPPPKADGSVFSHWVYVLTPVGGGTPTRIKVTPGFQFDPRSIALNLPRRFDFDPALPLVANRDDGYYVCDLYAVYQAPSGPDDCGLPWWLLPLGGVGLLGAGGVAIAGMTLPWLVALPLLPVLLLVGGKLIGREKPAQEGKKEAVPPPKTGESNAWVLLPIAGIGLAGVWLVVLRRRRREEEVFA